MAKQGEHGISWTDETWNPTRGCTRVSEGCRNCYAELLAARFAHGAVAVRDSDTVRRLNGPFAGFATMTSVGPRWTGKVELIPERLEDPLHWRKPRRVFVDSMSDLFHEALPDEAIDRVFAVMALCPQHQFQVLTKREQRMLKYLTDPDRRSEVEDAGSSIPGICYANTQAGWPLPNVWLGVSVEDQTTADARIPLLLQTPAAVRFVSYEPALGPLCIPYFLRTVSTAWGHLPPLNWLITGGESGPHARPAHPQWFRDVRDQCLAAGVPFHFKQWGEFSPQIGDVLEHRIIMVDDGSDHNKAAMSRVGKRSAGRLLDGKRWDEFPATVQRLHWKSPLC